MMRIHRSLAMTTFLASLASVFMLSPASPLAAQEHDGLPARAADIDPLETGDRAPAFTVRTVDDEPYRFDPGQLQRPTILISFRGGWCPYCNLHLAELRTVIPEIRAMGYDILFLSGDRPDMLYNSLQKETQEAIEGLHYTILSDADI